MKRFVRAIILSLTLLSLVGLSNIQETEAHSVWYWQRYAYANQWNWVASIDPAFHLANGIYVHMTSPAGRYCAYRAVYFYSGGYAIYPNQVTTYGGEPGSRWLAPLHWQPNAYRVEVHAYCWTWAGWIQGSVRDS